MSEDCQVRGSGKRSFSLRVKTANGDICGSSFLYLTTIFLCAKHLFSDIRDSLTATLIFREDKAKTNSLKGGLIKGLSR